MERLAKPMPARIAGARRHVCSTLCDKPCAEIRSGVMDWHDPKAQCPRKGWLHAWGSYGRTVERSRAVEMPVPIPDRVREQRISASRKAVRAAGAMAKWSAAGFPLVDAAIRKERQAICEACPAWRPKGNLGLGECVDPRCGCSRLKRWLATERCPAGKWPERGGKLSFRGLATAWKGAWKRALGRLRKGL